MVMLAKDYFDTFLLLLALELGARTTPNCKLRRKTFSEGTLTFELCDLPESDPSCHSEFGVRDETFPNSDRPFSFSCLASPSHEIKIWDENFGWETLRNRFLMLLLVVLERHAIKCTNEV